MKLLKVSIRLIMFLSPTKANSADLDEMPHFTVSLLGLHNLTVNPVYGF